MPALSFWGKRGLWAAVLLCSAAASYSGRVAANTTPSEQARVLHWWVADSEQASLSSLRRHARRWGLEWIDAAPQSDALQNYPDLLTRAARSGSGVDAALVQGASVPRLAALGRLASLDEVAQQEYWEEVLPYAVQRQARYQGHWMAAPVNLHSSNWLWAHPDLLAQLGVHEAPDDFPELLALLERAHAAGIGGLLMSNHLYEPWLLFELVAMGHLGMERYRHTLLAQQPQSLSPATWRRIFHKIDQLKPYIVKGHQRRSWQTSVELLSKGQALMMLGGTWVEHALRERGVQSPCWRFPDTQGMVHFNSDLLVFFRQGPDPQPSYAQNALASMVMDTRVQADRSRYGGAIPARVDVLPTASTPCAKQALHDIRMANTRDALIPTLFMGEQRSNVFVQQLALTVLEHFYDKRSLDATVASLVEQIPTTSAP